VFDALTRNGYGQYDGLIQTLQPALGSMGLEYLRQRMVGLSAQPVRKPAAKDRQIIGWSSKGAIYADEIAERSRVSTVRLALQEIADAQGDVDAFIAQYEEPVRLAAAIQDYVSFETHDSYISRLRQEHSKKAAFWAMVS
jgi:hypothetical protein